MLNLKDANYYARKLFSTNWVKWVHEGSKSAETNTDKSLNVIKSIITGHCARCLNLNGCCFVKNKCPTKPLHVNCHCYIVNIPTITALAECSINKFTNYIFIEGNSKKQLFESWGYSIIDSEYLQQEFVQQARLAYSVGDYELGLLNEFGQRIKIRITLKKKNKNEYVSFDSSWMVYPNGKIILTTPYGGK